MSSTQIFSTSSNLPTPTPSSVEPLLNSFPPSSSLSTQPQPHHHSHLNLHPQSQSPRSSSESESLLRDHPSSSSHNKHDFLRSHSRSQKLNSHTLRWVLAITGLGAAIYLLFVLWSSNRQLARSLQSLTQHIPASDQRLNSEKLPTLLAHPNSLCDFCDCSVNRTSPPLLPLTTQSPKSGTPAFLSLAVLTSIRDTYCHHPYLAEGTARDLLLQTDLTHDIRSVLQWNITPLVPSVATSYLYTKTSAAGRTGHLREAYFKRHILTVRTHLALVANRPWPLDGPQARWGSHRQLVWIVIEDSDKLSSDVANVLAKSELPYIYLTYGPTHHYGNAQQNAAYSIIHRLSNPNGGVFGHGPVVSIDDDSNFLPQLLELVWGVRRIGTWPMGNLGPNGWEGPVYDANRTLLRWEAGAVENRKFPVDNGAFCFASDLLGEVIKGPHYWPTDFSGGENEFISQLVKTKEELEPICYNCHVAWHNEPLPRECTVNHICG